MNIPDREEDSEARIDPRDPRDGRATPDAIRRCRETPGDVLPEPGARFRDKFRRDPKREGDKFR